MLTLQLPCGKNKQRFTMCVFILLKLNAQITAETAHSTFPLPFIEFSFNSHKDTVLASFRGGETGAQ
jgi:hypothetical protein